MVPTKLNMFVNSTTDFTIQDDMGTVYTPEEARKLWEAQAIDDWNLAFDRLARDYNFDIEALKAFYKENS